MEIERIADQPAVIRARDLLRRSDPATLDDQLEVVRIPAPPFGESRRARWLAGRFRDVGLVDVGVDEVGNVHGRLPAGRATDGDGGRARPRAAHDAVVVVAAHLDTVFADETEIRPRRDGDRWIAPGIADNARGIAVMLALARSLVAARVATARRLVFVGTVGEEGEGDLRGVKHLFRPDGGFRRAAGFIALDGAGCDRIIQRALGARRFRVTVTGPGGHSWADWGRPNPIHALGRAVAALATLEPPDAPRSTRSVGRIRGGTSVNSIPQEAWCEVDLRGEDAGTLDTLAERVRAIVEHACEQENAAGLPGPGLDLVSRTIGDRPTGETPSDSALVRAARDATRFVGGRPEAASSSTDANVPIAHGIPAIALGAGGEAGEIHTTDEWFTNVRGVEGAERALLVALAAAGLVQR